jgi:hypothetical protein
VCQRHSRAIKVLGLASAFFRIWHVSQAKVFSEDGLGLVIMFFSLPLSRGVSIDSGVSGERWLLSTAVHLFEVRVISTQA